MFAEIGLADVGRNLFQTLTKKPNHHRRPELLLLLLFLSSLQKKCFRFFGGQKLKDCLRENLFSCYAFVDAPHLVTRHLMMTILHVCNGNLVFLFSLNFWKKFTSAISNFPSGGVHTSGVKKRIAL